MAKRNTFVGMDVHKESIDISVADEGRHGEIRHYGVITGDLAAVATSLRALRAPNRRISPTSATRPTAVTNETPRSACSAATTAAQRHVGASCRS